MITPSKILRTCTTLALAALVLAVGSTAHARLVGKLETPEGSAAGISNVQGWVYTTTPGASLVSPFDVLVNGVKIMSVPCCSERGDVKDAHPAAPLRTGFSGTTNWAREARSGPIEVAVVVRDTTGDEIILRNTDVDVYSATEMPYSVFGEWSFDPSGLTHWLDPVGHAVTGIPSWCALSNDGPGEVAELACTGFTSTSREGDVEKCDGVVRYRWDRSTQGFKQVSNCEQPQRYAAHGDGTMTDARTGLMWELIPTESSPALYQWSTGTHGKPDGNAFTDKVGLANGMDGSPCKAGYCDWRLPTHEELLTLIDTRACTGANPCTTIPGQVGDIYWSASTSHTGSSALVVDFRNGHSLPSPKTATSNVRLVRGSMPRMVTIPPSLFIPIPPIDLGDIDIWLSE